MSVHNPGYPLSVEGISDPEAEVIREKKAFQDRQSFLGDLSKKIFHSFDGLISVDRSGDECRSGDGASLFTVVEAKKNDGAVQKEPIKLAWGEFSESTFEGELPEVDPKDYKNQQKRALRELPVPLFVLPQNEGYFAFSKPEIFASFMRDPLTYFSQHAKLIYNNGEVIVKRKWRDKSSADLTKVEIPPYESALNHMRNQAIATNTTPEEFADFLSRLPDDPKKLSAQLAEYHRQGEVSERDLPNLSDEKQAQQKDIRQFVLLRELGIKQNYQLCWGRDNEEAIEAVRALKAKFDFEKKQFSV